MPTVWLTLPECYILILLQRMEHRPDITITQSIHDVGTILVHLDSDQFPAKWHGLEVTLDFDPSERGGIRISRK
jgi:hypothetical protein